MWDNILTNICFIGFCHEPKQDDCSHRFEEDKTVMAENENFDSRILQQPDTIILAGEILEKASNIKYLGIVIDHLS